MSKALCGDRAGWDAAADPLQTLLGRLGHRPAGSRTWKLDVRLTVVGLFAHGYSPRLIEPLLCSHYSINSIQSLI